MFDVVGNDKGYDDDGDDDNDGGFSGDGDGSGDGGGHNECRLIPEHAFRLFSLSMNTLKMDLVSAKYLSDLFPSRSLGEGRPFCFVNTTDPRVKEFSAKTGEKFDLCAELQLLPCGVRRCAVDTSPGTSAPAPRCLRAPAAEASTPANGVFNNASEERREKLLLANGGFELWARRTNSNGLIRDVSIAKNDPSALAWADVTYQKYPGETGYPAGANPAEPRFWDLCFYQQADLRQMGAGYNASGVFDARAGHSLHKLGSLVQCDPVIPRAQGVSLERHAPGRDGGSGAAAARFAFVKANDVAAVKSENGAVASVAPGAFHVARVWVRCVKGAATVALVVSSLPESARLSEEKGGISLDHYDALMNVTVGSNGPMNLLRCVHSDPTVNSNASSWTRLEVGFTSSQPVHEASVQLVAQSHSDDVVILVDDASLEVVTGGGSSASSTSTSSACCTGGGGAGVSYSDSHRCSADPTRLFYRLRELGGVPVAVEQIHAMVTLGYVSIKCRKPEMDPSSTVECPHLSHATLPHLSAQDVKT